MDTVILWFLGLCTLRVLIADTGWIPRDRPYSRLFYNHREFEFLKHLIKTSPELIAELRSKLEIPADPVFEKQQLTELVKLMIRHLQTFKTEDSYGRSSPSRSRYDINTMEAAH